MVEISIEFSFFRIEAYSTVQRLDKMSQERHGWMLSKFLHLVSLDEHSNNIEKFTRVQFHLHSARFFTNTEVHALNTPGKTSTSC